MDKELNQKRLLKAQNYQKAVLMDSITEKRERAAQIEREKCQILEERKRMRQQIEIDKEIMKSKFEKMKQDQNAQAYQNQLKVTKEKEALKESPQKRKVKKKQKKKKRLKQVKPSNTPFAALSLEQHEIEKGLTEEEVNEKIEDISKKQNLSLLRMLEREQESEAQRSSELSKIADPKLRFRKEKEFGEQRQQAVLRIQKLQVRHE